MLGIIAGETSLPKYLITITLSLQKWLSDNTESHYYNFKGSTITIFFSINLQFADY